MKAKISKAYPNLSKALVESTVFILFFLHGSFPPLCWTVVDILRFFCYALQAYLGKSLYLACIVFTLMQNRILPLDFVNRFSIRLVLSNILSVWKIISDDVNGSLIRLGTEETSFCPLFSQLFFPNISKEDRQ